jgi:hypothetical protein
MLTDRRQLRLDKEPSDPMVLLDRRLRDCAGGPLDVAE